MKVKLYAWWLQFTEDTSPHLYITAHVPSPRSGVQVQVIEADLDIIPPLGWAEQEEARKKAELDSLDNEINRLQTLLDTNRARKTALIAGVEANTVEAK